MKRSDFYYELPQELIAQSPACPRDASRLLHMDKASGKLHDRTFCNLPSLLQKGDLLVLNNTRVLPSRLIGHKPETGGVCELLLLRQQELNVWCCLARPAKRMKAGTQLVFGDGTLTAHVVEDLPEGQKIVQFKHDSSSLHEKLEQFGSMPLPPYIKERLKNNEDYQTVYAKHLGSAAAPTAGLHFTQTLFDALDEKGVGIAELTLHVGLGTFRPVQAEQIEEHTMHSEWYTLSDETRCAIERTKSSGGRVIAVGTTSCRALESAAQETGALQSKTANTNIFIYPGYNFKVIDGLITNFHLPESTLIMLVSAFCGRENTMAAYHHAVKEKYRFFSFGDAMLII